jgi:hypothetical protein
MRQIQAAIVLSLIALSGCSSPQERAAQAAARRAQIISSARDSCSGFGHKDGSPEMTRCTEEMFKKAIDIEVELERQQSNVRAAGASKNVYCTKIGDSVSCF